MKINLESLRAVVRPYASKELELSGLLEKLWPMLVEMDDDNSKELVESVQDLLALHAARSIDEVALRQRLIRIAFPPATFANVVVFDIRSSAPQPVGGLQQPNYSISDAKISEAIHA